MEGHICPCYSTASTTGTTCGWAYMPARDTRAKQRARNKEAEEGVDEKAYNVYNAYNVLTKWLRRW